MWLPSCQDLAMASKYIIIIAIHCILSYDAARLLDLVSCSSNHENEAEVGVYCFPTTESTR